MGSAKITAIDLFCGAGGLTYGLEQAGISVAAGYDVDRECKYPFEANNRARFVQQDVNKVTVDEIKKQFGRSKIRLIAGCAPCQPFSSHSKGKDTTSDPKWPLLDEFSRIVRGVLPELVTMENVARIQGHRIFKKFVKDLELAGYFVAWKSLYCPDFGIPQERRRLVLMASRLGSIEVPAAPGVTKIPTVRSAIGKLMKLNAGEYSVNDPLHMTRNLTDINVKRLRFSKPGGTWHDWPRELLSPCHRKSTGQSFKSVYARMSWDEPSPTITTQYFNFGTGRFGHPEQNRALSLREGAILQSFPSNYKFVPKGDVPRMMTIGRLIGNAVPPKLGEVIGKAFIQHVGAFQ